MNLDLFLSTLSKSGLSEGTQYVYTRVLRQADKAGVLSGQITTSQHLASLPPSQRGTFQAAWNLCVATQGAPQLALGRRQAVPHHPEILDQLFLDYLTQHRPDTRTKYVLVLNRALHLWGGKPAQTEEQVRAYLETLPVGQQVLFQPAWNALAASHPGAYPILKAPRGGTKTVIPTELDLIIFPVAVLCEAQKAISPGAGAIETGGALTWLPVSQTVKGLGTNLDDARIWLGNGAIQEILTRSWPKGPPSPEALFLPSKPESSVRIEMHEIDDALWRQFKIGFDDLQAGHFLLPGAPKNQGPEYTEAWMKSPQYQTYIQARDTYRKRKEARAAALKVLQGS